MGTYSKSNFGKISGKVGEGVGSKWRGLKVLRSLPTKSSKPITASQLAVHAKFALSAAHLGPIKDILNLGFSDKKLNKLTGYNAAARAFLTEAIIGDYPNFAVDYSRIRMSKGSLIQADVSLNAETEIVLSWPADLNEFNAFADDKMMFIIYNETRKSYILNDAYTRSEINIAIPFRGRPNDVLHIWSFCVQRDRKAVSSSVYVGTAIVPLLEAI